MRHPLKLRMILCFALLIAWYLGIFAPIGEQTQSATMRISREQKRIATAKESRLSENRWHRTTNSFGRRRSQRTDAKRNGPPPVFPAQTHRFETRGDKELGPYRTVGVQFTLEGQFAEIDTFLGWVESGARPLRVDSHQDGPEPPKSRCDQSSSNAVRALKVVAAPFRVLDAAVSAEPYLLGGDFTVADLNVAAVISRAVDMDLAPSPHLQDWLTRCLGRPAARAALELKTQSDATTPVDVTRRIAQINRL